MVEKAMPPKDENDEADGTDNDILSRMREERILAERHISELMEEAGKGLFQSQVALKQAPWKVVWLKQDMMLERQERMIGILTKINGNLEKLLETIAK